MSELPRCRTILPPPMPPPDPPGGAAEPLPCFRGSLRTAVERLTKDRTLQRAIGSGGAACQVVLLLPEASRRLAIALRDDGMRVLRSEGLSDIFGSEVSVVSCSVERLQQVVAPFPPQHAKNARAVALAHQDAASRGKTIVAMVTRFNAYTVEA